MNRRGFLRLTGRAIVGVAALRAVPLESLQQFIPYGLRESVGLAYLRRAFIQYCAGASKATGAFAVPAYIEAGWQLFERAEAELSGLFGIVYSYPGIPDSIVFKGVPMIRNAKREWTLTFHDVDTRHAKRRDGRYEFDYDADDPAALGLEYGAS